MATVTSYTKDRLDTLLDENVVDGAVVGDNLILEKRDGSTVNAGNVRGPAGTDGIDAPTGSVSVAPDTTVVRTSVDGRAKVGTPTATDDATTKAYVDAADSSLDGRLDTLEGQTLDTRLDSAETSIADHETRLDDIDSLGLVCRVGSHIRTTNTTAANAETNVSSFTIPNPVNGRTYRVTFQGNFVVNASSQVRIRIKHGIGAVTGGTQIGEVCLDFQSIRDQSASIVCEFTFTGTTGQSSYNVVATHVNITSSNTVGTSSASSTRPVTLIVDQII